MLQREKPSSSPPCIPAQRSCAVWGQVVDSQCSLPVLDTQELTAFPAAVSSAPGCAEASKLGREQDIIDSGSFLPWC